MRSCSLVKAFHYSIIYLRQMHQRPSLTHSRLRLNKCSAGSSFKSTRAGVFHVKYGPNMFRYALCVYIAIPSFNNLVNIHFSGIRNELDPKGNHTYLQADCGHIGGSNPVPLECWESIRREVLDGRPPRRSVYTLTENSRSSETLTSIRRGANLVLS